MKTTIKLGLLLTILYLAASPAYSQIQYGRKYRVIAYKSGNPAVFSISNEVEVVPSMTLYVPNTFTPNGDGLNDTFGINGEAIKDFSMSIYNRWGQMIFESTNANHRWDGTFKGERVLEGIYIYKINATGPTGNKELKEGQVNVIM